MPEDSLRGAKAAFGRFQTKSGIVPVWVIDKSIASDEDLRSLRLSLLRLHAEQEVLDIVLKQLQRKWLDPPTKTAVDLIDDYFNSCTRIINRDSWAGIKQSAIREAVNAADQVTPIASKQTLASRYAGARKQVWAKVEQYQLEGAAARTVRVIYIGPGGTLVEKQINITQTGNGIINVAEYMQNVSNNINNSLAKSSADEETKRLVEELTSKITAIAADADALQVQKLGKNLERLSQELSEPEPDRAWYEVSLKGLKDAATAVGEVAVPVLAVVAKLQAILAP